MMSLRTLFLDFNSYFASVEQQRDPKLRGRPVAVVPMMAETTCCIAASYEAKRFGVKTGTMVAEARRLCPEIVFVVAEHEQYVRYHHRLVEVVESCLHVDAVHSIDELSCELPANFREEGAALGLARRLKKKIREEVGEFLKCSIGVAPNRFLAKTATDMQKPDGLVVIRREDLPECLYGLELRDLCGIGERMEARLRAHGICSVRDLLEARKELLRAVWGGIEGERMYERLRGREVYEPPTSRTTVGHSHVLAPEERNAEQAFAVLSRLTQKAAARLRHMGYFAGGLHLAVKYRDRSRDGGEVRFDATQDTLVFLRVLGDLWGRRRFKGKSPLAVGVTLFDIMEAGAVTPSFFADVEERGRLNAALDELNMRFGKDTVFFGGAAAAIKSAPMRIAFHHVPDLQVES